MGTRSDPQSHTWTLEAVSNILTTNTKMLKCEAEEEFSALVPEDLLCYFSRYYAALLRGGDAESGQDNITLELNSTQAQWFVTWLYTGRFPEDFDYPTLFQLYVFAEETEITALRRGIMTYIHEQSHRRANPSTEDAAEAFDRLPKSSGLVRWIVERFALHGGADTLWDYPDFFVHVAHAFDNFYKHACPTVRRLVFMDPCCSVIHDYGCDSNCAHPADMVKRGQACAYHEHSSPEEWKTCAGDDFEQSVDLIYLKGKTATDAVPQLRFAKFDASNRWFTHSADVRERDPVQWFLITEGRDQSRKKVLGGARHQGVRQMFKDILEQVYFIDSLSLNIRRDLVADSILQQRRVRGKA